VDTVVQVTQSPPQPVIVAITDGGDAVTVAVGTTASAANLAVVQSTQPVNVATVQSPQAVNVEVVEAQPGDPGANAEVVVLRDIPGGATAMAQYIALSPAEQMSGTWFVIAK
jgi:hypothetical protein